MTDEEFAAWEAENWDAPDPEQARIAQATIRGYAVAMCEGASLAKKDVERAIAALLRARKRAERAVRNCHRACEQAELASNFAARCIAGDTPGDVQIDVAALLQEMLT